MSGRIIFCCDLPFPRGNAGANRVYYVAKALAAAGREVVVLARSTIPNQKVKDVFGGINYIGLPVRNGKLGRLLDEKIFNGRKMVKLLKEMPLKHGDVVYLYANSAMFVYPVMRFCQRQGISI